MSSVVDNLSVLFRATHMLYKPRQPEMLVNWYEISNAHFMGEVHT